ncbi:MAG: DUF2169 domain-containing protein [Desulfobacteraceae bacterium]|nr:DUF2169 domain-containing protein [Desulfobacteraceae bacterium]
MQIHEKYNHTQFVAGFGFCQDKEGLEYVTAVLKATFCFDATGLISIPERKAMCPIFDRDIFYGKPDSSSLKYPSDIVHAKPGTDIIINGQAYGRRQKEIRAGFRIGALEKFIAVCGPRRWERSLVGMVQISAPQQFEAIAVSYENAFGGAFTHDQHGFWCYRHNPVGIGFCEKIAEGQPLPLLEYPQQRIASANDRPLPAALGAVAVGWQQRTQFAGTFDQQWFNQRRPLWPLDFDERFYNTVAQDQVLNAKLQGGEQLILLNLHPQAEMVQLTIPRHQFTVMFRIKDRTDTLTMVADTLLVEPDEGRFSIAYRGAVPIGNDIRFLKSVHFEEV